MSNTKILKKNYVKFEFFGQKTLFQGQKSLEKVWKFWKQVFPNVRKFRKFGNSELSENYKKMMFNSKFKNREKLVPTQKPTRKFC